MASSSDISSIPTPAHCTADFCLIPVRSEFSFQNPSINPDYTSGKNQQYTCNPTTQQHIGTSSPSVSAQIADVQRLIEKSGLKYVMHSAGTTLGMKCDEMIESHNP
ncbi:hypothetical protein BDV27DRAFT_159866 [Aspergillus caelatus]|uniref:Thiamine-binding protein domain-containing protein n=2 Tax=Aspergillus subgen. Circumdati TaxID=2720871 RepID=A0A5N6ZZF6_9EURO|nr:uncharacterized protein BDV27DRAFT_159866 [Aspergillus caelatus]KAE8362319.1 hypothetical protein BDV27DRAFT_159866 [Aspergillus caelatus]KAE8412810.1 hypothetical protein BDV36DRAFT_300547 [Aspergillus pseudocaelatus]